MMKIRFIIWAAIFGFLEGALQSDTLGFLVEPKDIYVEEGQEGILRCTFSATAPQCYWNKDGRTMEIRDRYEWLGDPQQGNCTIRMKSNYSLDNGTWQCGTKGSSSQHGLISKSIQFTVFVPPGDPIILVNGTTMNKNSDLILDNFDDIPSIFCASETGFPAANLKWNFNGKYAAGELIVNQTNNMPNSKLLLKATIDSTWYGGKLMCIADHITYGFNQQRMTYVNVKFPRVTTNVSVTTDFGDWLVDLDQLEVSDTLTLYCIANGDPSPSYSWEMRVSEERQWQMFSEIQNVTFHPIRGQFSCLAWNEFDGQNKVRSEHIITVIGTNLSDRNGNQAEMYFVAFGLAATLLLLIAFGTVVVIFQRKRRAINKNRQWGPQSKHNKQRVGLNNRPSLDHKKLGGIKKNPQFFANTNQIVPTRKLDTMYLSPIPPNVNASTLSNVVAGEKEEPIYQEILPC